MQLTDVKAQLVMLAMKQGHDSAQAQAERMTRAVGAPAGAADSAQPQQQPDEAFQ
jgi:hypothetical protein